MLRAAVPLASRVVVLVVAAAVVVEKVEVLLSYAIPGSKDLQKLRYCLYSRLYYRAKTNVLLCPLRHLFVERKRERRPAALEDPKISSVGQGRLLDDPWAANEKEHAFQGGFLPTLVGAGLWSMAS